MPQREGAIEMKLWHDVIRSEREDAPAVAFLHAFPLDSRMWRAQVAHLKGRATTIVMDARGYGRSPVTDDMPFTIELYAKDAIDTLDAAGIERAVLVGCSMGGYAMFEIWRKYESRVAGMLLCDTRAEADTDETRGKRKQQIDRILREGAGFMEQFVIDNLIGPSTRERKAELVQEVRGWVREAPDAAIVHALTGLAERPDSGPTLPTIDVPVVVVVGEHDAVTPVDAARRLERDIPNARLHVISRAGHLSPLENPAAVNDALDELMAEFS
jgi:pimeloyl-ACP methyl ester carboxylesterase